MLTANNVSVTEVRGFNKDGTAFKAEQLKFWVGNNGPFTKLFNAERDNTSDIKAYIASKVQQINAAVTVA